MLILPDRTAPVGKALLPMRRRDWQAPSRAQPRDQFGRQDRKGSTLRAVLDDGHVRWAGRFEDREDADAFLWAMATGTLLRERELWDLPTPAWHPDVGVDLVYQFYSFSIITSSAGSNQDWPVPIDWNNLDNFVDCIAGGSGGARAGSTSGSRGGPGAGGAWARRYNIVLTRGGVAELQVGYAGNAVTAGTAPAGGDSWFNAATFAEASCGAKGPPRGGQVNNGGNVGSPGTGGPAASCIGDAANDGGDGATASSSTSSAGAGAAAGPDAAGGNGAATGAGGQGNGGLNGGGSSGSGSGSTYEGTAGPGGGANGVGSQNNGNSGGAYGAGGSGARSTGNNRDGGPGAQGMIYARYTPAMSLPLRNRTFDFNHMLVR